MSQYFGHSHGGTDNRSQWQGLKEHLINTGDLASHSARYFACEELAKISGLLHDVGKYTREFQARLEGTTTRVDHATHGAILAKERYGSLGLLLGYGIAGHHAGLANGLNPEKRSSLKERFGKELPELDPIWQMEIELPLNLKTPPLRAAPSRKTFQMAFLGRMLFSCLVDADFLDTEAYYAKVETNRQPRTLKHPDLLELRERLDRHLAKFRPDTPINKTRARILKHVRAQAEQTPGLFSLNVPTGGGKTLSSLAFALDHAIAHQLRRVIFVIPFTSIVEQNAAVFRRALNDHDGMIVLEHHSAYSDDRTKRREARDKLRLAMENWDAPIIVTTAVQFFESLFADRPSHCRKLHNMTGSVIILDEAQTLPLKLLRPCVAAMDELALNYRSSLVLCTATQPALLKRDGFVDGLEHVRELAPNPDALHVELKRVQIHHRGKLNDQELVNELNQREQVLCIVNNRRHARALYDAIHHEQGARHLTTLMCARHRSKVLEEIRQDLKGRKPCRLVSTSLIEAGVDVDFPAVYRAEAGLDAIAQAAGRCNREGRYAVDESTVNVFAVADDWPTPPELEQFAQAARAIFRRYPGEPLTLEALNEYFRELYWQKGKEQLDIHDLLGRTEASGLDGIPFETMALKFCMIESNMLPVIVPYDDSAKKLIERLRFTENCGGLARRLQPYLVQVPERVHQALSSAGAIQPVQEQSFGEQFMELVNLDIYDRNCGLSMEDSLFIRSEKLVCC